jgi:hypothetical protein
MKVRRSAAIAATLAAAGIALAACGGTPAPAPAASHAAAPVYTAAAPAASAPPTSVDITPVGQVLGHLSGQGIANSAPFLVPASPVTVTYTYNCSAAGGSGNFIADLRTPDQSGDDQSIANALGAGGTVTTSVYPASTGQDYYISVNSECTWTVTVKTG